MHTYMYMSVVLYNVFTSMYNKRTHGILPRVLLFGADIASVQLARAVL